MRENEGVPPPRFPLTTSIVGKWTTSRHAPWDDLIPERLKDVKIESL